jgi:ferredoxin
MNDIKVERFTTGYDDDIICEPIKKIKEIKISGEKSHKCGECNAVFKTNARLKEHIIIHTGNKPFTCELCDKSYNSRSNLRKHKELHKNLEVECYHCPKVFSSKYQMRQHLRIHSTNNLLKCNFCTYEKEQKLTWTCILKDIFTLCHFHVHIHIVIWNFPLRQTERSIFTHTWMLKCLNAQSVLKR